MSSLFISESPQLTVDNWPTHQGTMVLPWAMLAGPSRCPFSYTPFVQMDPMWIDQYDVSGVRFSLLFEVQRSNQGVHIRSAESLGWEIVKGQW